MGILKNRITALEQVAAASEPVEPVPVYFLPPANDDERMLKRRVVQAEIDACNASGRKWIVFTVIDASLGAPDPGQLQDGLVD